MDALEKVKEAQTLLRSTGNNWQEQCLFDCDAILTSLMEDVCRLQRIVSTAELINAEAQLKNDNDSKSLSISNNLLRDLKDALDTGTDQS